MTERLCEKCGGPLPAASETKKPAHVTDAMLEYLDGLRESYLAYGPSLQEKFGLSRAEANAALVYWIATFDERHPRGDE